MRRERATHERPVARGRHAARQVPPGGSYRTWVAAASALIAVMCVTPRAAAAVPHYLSVQGVLSDGAGQPIAGSRSFTFRIYDEAALGNLLWSEVQVVTLTEGRYSVLLGSVTALDLPFDEDYWLSIEVESDGEMTPLYRIASSAYAYNSETVNGIRAEAVPTPNALLPLDGTGKFPNSVLNTGTSTGQIVVLEGSDQLPAVDGSQLTGVSAPDSHTVDGIHASAAPAADRLFPLDANAKVPNGVLYTGAGGGLNADMVDGLHASDFADTHSLDAADGAPADAVYVDNDGKVGVGTPAPATELHVAGTVTTQGLTMPTGAADGRVLTSNASGGATWQPLPATPGVVPVGAVVAWLKSMPGTPLALPADFVECNGQVLNDAASVYNGETIPDLNGVGAGPQRFLSGSTASGATGGEDSHILTVAEMPAHTHGVPFQADSGSSSSSPAESVRPPDWSKFNSQSAGGDLAHENRPPFYEVVWIMRIK